MELQSERGPIALGLDDSHRFGQLDPFGCQRSTRARVEGQDHVLAQPTNRAEKRTKGSGFISAQQAHL